MSLPARKLFALSGCIAVIAISFALGVWQLDRLAWKRELIAQVEAQQQAAPAAAPSPNAQPVAYQKVYVHGRWVAGKDTFVLAVTKLGRGYWLMTPLETPEGRTILVNRGFVPETLAKSPNAFSPPGGDVTVRGLLRLSEPSHGFLRHNNPAADRWYSRHVESIAQARGITDAAPYFIDADAAEGDAFPRGGLTVIRFRDHHLQYAITWFCLSLGLSATLAYLWRSGKLG